MAYDVFISYSRRDYTDESNQVIPGNIITQIKQLLDANGITYWFDEDGIFSGDAFAPEIARNIKSSKIFLFVSSEHSNASEWTSNEIATAHTYKKKIIPFKYDDSIYNDSVIMYISRLDYIDYPANPIKALDRLLSSIKDYLNKLAEKEQNERLAEERRRNEEISRKEKAAKLQALKEKITTLETRKLDIEKDILSQEKSLSELRNEKRIIELNIAEVEEEIEALSPRKKADSASIITNVVKQEGRNAEVPNGKETNTTPGFFAREWAELRKVMHQKHWARNTIEISAFAIAIVPTLFLIMCSIAFVDSNLDDAIEAALLAFACIAGVCSLYRVIKNRKDGFLYAGLSFVFAVLGVVGATLARKTLLLLAILGALGFLSLLIWGFVQYKKQGKEFIKEFLSDWLRLTTIASLLLSSILAIVRFYFNILINL